MAVRKPVVLINGEKQLLPDTDSVPNADKLDGKDSTEFASASHNHDSQYLGISAKAADSDKLDGNDSTYFATADDLTSHTTNTNNPHNVTAAQLGAANILTQIKTVDGAGSGLDADLLDGQQGSYYTNASNIVNTPAGGISAVTVQAALNELDSEKVSKISSTTNALARYADTSGNLSNSSVKLSTDGQRILLGSSTDNGVDGIQSSLNIRAPYIIANVKGQIQSQQYSNPLASLNLTGDTKGYINGVQTFGNLSGGGEWAGLALAPNGCLYGAPYHSTTVLKISGVDVGEHWWALSNYVNKL